MEETSSFSSASIHDWNQTLVDCLKKVVMLQLESTDDGTYSGVDERGEEKSTIQQIENYSN